MHIQALQLYISYRKAIRITLIIVLLLLGTYVFSVNQTVRHIVERKELEASNSALGSHVSELEFTYMRYKNDITQERALSSGFSEATKVTFVSRIPEGTTLTLNR